VRREVAAVVELITHNIVSKFKNKKRQYIYNHIHVVIIIRAKPKRFSRVYTRHKLLIQASLCRLLTSAVAVKVERNSEINHAAIQPYEFNSLVSRL
jgi:hypothetical protein